MASAAADMVACLALLAFTSFVYCVYLGGLVGGGNYPLYSHRYALEDR